MHWAGQTYTRITPQDQQHYDARLAKQKARGGPWVRGMLTMRDCLQWAIPTGILFLKFMEWWYTTGRAEARKEEDLMERDAIPPPKSKEVVRYLTGYFICQILPSMELPLDPKKCPLCRLKRTNPCQLVVSGYVFCYPCIYSFLERERKCPVTGTSISAEGLLSRYLRKLYDDEKR
jgi:hypothetical protein